MKTATRLRESGRRGGREGLPDRAVEEKGQGAGILEADRGKIQQEAFREVSCNTELSNVNVGLEGMFLLSSTKQMSAKFEINLVCKSLCVNLKMRSADLEQIFIVLSRPRIV